MSTVLDLVADYRPYSILYTLTSLAIHLFLNALVTASAGLDSASKLAWFCTRHGMSAKVGVTRNFVVFAGELHYNSITQDRFYTV